MLTNKQCSAYIHQGSQCSYEQELIPVWSAMALSAEIELSHLSASLCCVSRSKELLAKGYLKGFDPEVSPTSIDFPFSSNRSSEDPTLHFLWGPPCYNG